MWHIKSVSLACHSNMWPQGARWSQSRSQSPDPEFLSVFFLPRGSLLALAPASSPLSTMSRCRSGKRSPQLFPVFVWWISSSELWMKAERHSPQPWSCGPLKWPEIPAAEPRRSAMQEKQTILASGPSAVEGNGRILLRCVIIFGWKLPPQCETALKDCVILWTHSSTCDQVCMPRPLSSPSVHASIVCYHNYADDIQIYVSLTVGDCGPVGSFYQISVWMQNHFPIKVR